MAYIHEQRGKTGWLTGFPPDGWMVGIPIYPYRKCCLDKRNYQRGGLLVDNGITRIYKVVCAKCGARMFAMDWYEMPEAAHD